MRGLTNVNQTVCENWAVLGYCAERWVVVIPYRRLVNLLVPSSSVKNPNWKPIVEDGNDSLSRNLGKKLDCVWNVMAHAQKPDFVFRRKGRVHLCRQGHQFSRLLAAELCASAVVMLDTPSSEVVWRVLDTHSIRQFSLHFPSCASPCAITFQVDSTITCCIITQKSTVLMYFQAEAWNHAQSCLAEMSLLSPILL